MATVLQTDLPGIELLARGKVRDTYVVDEETLLFIASDRLSAFDVVMTSGIPDKGRVLTQMTLFWLELFKDLIPNHLISADLADMPDWAQAHADQLAGRSMLVKRLKMLPVEAIVRGYLAGSGWKEYRKQGTVCDIRLPAGLQESSRLPKALYTPSTKAEIGDHDENIHPDEAARILGPELAGQVEELAITLYERAAETALERGIIIADTKFEFGVNEAGEVVLADGVLTPDASRFWPVDLYEEGRGQPSYDKQYVRDWLEASGFELVSAESLVPQRYALVFRKATTLGR